MWTSFEPPHAVTSYVERLPVPALTGVVRTVWIQQTGSSAYVQRHLPTGGVELHLPIGFDPQLVGPLTGPIVEVIAPRTTLLGVRFLPGAAPPLPEGLDSLVDLRLDLKELWGSLADRLMDDVMAAPSPEVALDRVQAHLVRGYRRSPPGDPLVQEAVRHLMPWHPVAISALADHLSISAPQLRRRCVRTLGVAPKALQRTLRLQGFLALAQAGAGPTGRRNAEGLSGLAVDVGYADHAHLSRECVRLTGLTPSVLLHGATDRCGCGHDHAASYRPFLATRVTTPLRR
jgi:AraC-like DNA-binding protein